MHKDFHQENRRALYQGLPEGSLLLIFSGQAPRRTNDEYYPFFANRNFVYLSGITQEQSILLYSNAGPKEQEILFMLPPDALAERWNGRRMKAAAIEEQSAVSDIRSLQHFPPFVEHLLKSGKIHQVYLDADDFTADKRDSGARRLAAQLREEYPFVQLRDILPQLRRLRTIKKPCEIAAMREAQKYTRAGILAMMQASRPGMYEYQYKAEFDYALAQLGGAVAGFPPIICAGANNFCIHYKQYGGQAQDGDLILNDVGACFDNQINDVSRAWPCNGRYSPRQKLLYECAYATSEYMFSILKPGIAMEEVDRMICRYNFERLQEAGVCKDYRDIETYMWHGGAHHIGFDVHDVVDKQQPLSPGMIFCVDIGIYHEEWGIGFRLEDDCLITENGCENLSAITPRSIEDIEAIMKG